MAASCKQPRKDVSQELREAVKGPRWEEAITIVRTCECSQQQRHWAVREVVMRASDRFVQEILEMCTAEELDWVLTYHLKRRKWKYVGSLLQRYITASSEQHKRAVVTALKYSHEQDFMTYILPHCTDEELELVLTHMVSRGLWKPVEGLTHSDVSIAQHFLRHIVSQGRWLAVDSFLQRDISSEQHRWAVEQASRHAQDDDFYCHIIHLCHDEELEEIMTQLVSRGMWMSVRMALHRGVSATQHKWAVEQASQREEERLFALGILSFCTEEELEEISTRLESMGLLNPADSATHCDTSYTERMLPQLVSQGLWPAVGRFVQRDISSEQHRWAVVQASKHADESVFRWSVLPECQDGELEEVLTELVSRGMWGSVAKVLERGMDTVQHRWAVEQAVGHASDAVFADQILPRCCDEELEETLNLLVSRGLWLSVCKVLERGVSTTQHRWAVEQASRHADGYHVAHYVLPLCTAEELEQVSAHMVSRGLWETVDVVTHCGISITQQVLSQLVSQGSWPAVGRFVQRDISSEQHRWAVVQASKHADDCVFASNILPECQEEELEEVLTHLVARGLWESVGEVLERGVSTTQHRWAIEQASQLADDNKFSHHILHQCDDEEMKDVMLRLVSRGLWQSVGEVLERGVSTSQRSWILEKAVHANDAREILPHCHDDDLEELLTHLVSRGVWYQVGKVLGRGVSATQHRWAVEQARKHSHDHDFVNWILPHCLDDVRVVEKEVTHLISQGEWELVGEWLMQGVSTKQHSWAVEQAIKHASDDGFCENIFPVCRDEELEEALTSLVSRGLWRSVGKVLARGVSSTQHRWAVEQASRRADDDSFDRFILRCCSNDDIFNVFLPLVANRKWRCVKHALHDVARDTLYTWVTSHDRRAHDTLLWKLLYNCRIDVSAALDLTKAVTRDTLDLTKTQDIQFQTHRRSIKKVSCLLFRKTSCDLELCELLVRTLLLTLCSVMCSADMGYMDISEHTKQCVSDIYMHINDCIQDNIDSLEMFTTSQSLKSLNNKGKWTAVFKDIADTHKTDPLVLIHFLQDLNLYYINRRGEYDDCMLLVIFAIFPLFPQLQSTALRMMLREKRWDIIKEACLSHVWDHDRRQLFKAAVEQSQWDVVRQWADHTVDDDQRDWAMKEALKEKQWMAYLLLADHGLTMPEHMNACYQVAKYGDWDTVLQMVQRGGDITKVSNLLGTWIAENRRKKPTEDVTIFQRRCEKLIRLKVRFEKNYSLHPMRSLQYCKWGSVLFNILHEPTEEYFSQVLHTVIEEQEWCILMHLVRLGMKRGGRDSLFPQMVRQQQWGVCRKLLEMGVDVQLCLEALPELMERNQWSLVVRVMGYSVDDAVRRRVMERAFQRRAGALFWHCLTNMDHEEQLSVETRVKLFHQAISRDMWQVVKPLVEEKDGPGIQCRDVAFLEAIEQRLWDVVDHCQVLGADINTEDENGETPLHREARTGEWKAVEEIVFRDGKPNLLDKDGVSVLNRLIRHGQWDIVKLVIKHGGDVHISAKRSENETVTRTPLQTLIDHHRMDIIDFTTIWCPEMRKAVNHKEETALHIVCDSDRWDMMEDLIVRQVDPLAETTTGQTALVYAVVNTQCPQRMVAECCSLGFSSHQPPVSEFMQRQLINGITQSMYHVRKYVRPSGYFSGFAMHNLVITSPLVCAVLRDLPEVILMLFESGSSSRTELLTLSTLLLKLTDSNTEEGRALYDMLFRETGMRRISTRGVLRFHATLTDIIQKNTAFMRRLASTPRTLLSSCRLQVLRHFHFSDTNRLAHMRELPLTVSLENYLEFSDFRDPGYGQHMVLPLPSHEGDESSDSEMFRDLGGRIHQQEYFDSDENEFLSDGSLMGFGDRDDDRF